MDKFITKTVRLLDLNAFNFVIPTYQRPYVWDQEQQVKLLNDMYSAYKNNEDAFYLGTILTKKRNDNEYELIDGQQRFTTLWLISFVITEYLKKESKTTGVKDSKITEFLKKGDDLRLKFDIRYEITNYLNALLHKENQLTNKFNNDFIKIQPYLKKIAEGLVNIKSYFEQLSDPNDIKDFGDFIYKKVILINNIAPNGTDLNKLFTTMNSSGVQLEQTDIIKANLLSKIELSTEKLLYSKVWEVCEDMNHYFEQNVSNAFPNLNIDFRSYVDFETFGLELKCEKEQSHAEFNINGLRDDLEFDSKNIDFPKDSNAQEKDDEVSCRSIISFPQLLLHTYRIHLYKTKQKDFEQQFHAKNCIEVFQSLIDCNNSNEIEIKNFFKLLWKVRYVFDKYIIKWFLDKNTKVESLELTYIPQESTPRSKARKSATLMLQSVLYFTGDYLRQYWITPLLNYLLKKHKELQSATCDKYLKYLEQMDNIFSTNSTSDKELSWKLLKGLEQDDLNLAIRNLDIDYFKKSKGTKFQHYWFQKLEYILWKNFPDKTNKKFKNYRITSGNSIEHIYPQNPNEKEKLGDEILNSFGNLVLLNVSQNSEYSNKDVSVKRAMFEGKNTFDTLKSYEIFSEISKNNVWTKKEILDHQNKMIKIIKEHYNQEN